MEGAEHRVLLATALTHELRVFLFLSFFSAMRVVHINKYKLKQDNQAEGYHSCSHHPKITPINIVHIYQSTSVLLQLGGVDFAMTFGYFWRHFYFFTKISNDVCLHQCLFGRSGTREATDTYWVEVTKHPTVHKVSVNSVKNETLVPCTCIYVYTASHITSMPECHSKRSFTRLCWVARAFLHPHL